MPESSFYILNTQPRENRLLPDLHAVPQPRDLRINRLDFLIFLAQFAADLLMGLPVAHMPFVQCLYALQDGLALFPRFVRLPPLFFDLVFELFQCPAFLVDFLIDGIGGDTGRCAQRDHQHRSNRVGPAPSHTLASSNRRKETKLPAQPRTIPTPTSNRQMESGKNMVSCLEAQNRPVLRIWCRNRSYISFNMNNQQAIPRPPSTAPS